MYDELLKRVRHHPLLAARRTAQDVENTVNDQLARLAPYISPNTVFLEVGAGGCQLSMALTSRVKKVIAVDVSNEITAHVKPPPNFELVISNGTNIPVPPGSIDVAFSNQLMEHLHPDDAAEQLREIYTALRPRRDVSRASRRTASAARTTYRAVSILLRQACTCTSTPSASSIACSSTWASRTHRCCSREAMFALPVPAITALESCVSALPGSLSRKVAYFRPMRGFLGIRIIARK